MPKTLNAVDKQSILGNYRQTQAMFPGNENTPVLTQVGIDYVVALLDNASDVYSIKDSVRDLLGRMATRDWCITSGVHAGGLGGAAGAADPAEHITLSAGGRGYHLRVIRKDRKLVLYDITGGDPAQVRVSNGRAQKLKRETPQEPTLIDNVQRQFALDDADTVKVLQIMNREGRFSLEAATRAVAAVQKMRARSKKG
jgi:hypothetical protein